MIDTMINFGYLIYFRKKKEKEIRVQVIKILKISHEHL